MSAPPPSLSTPPTKAAGSTATKKVLVVVPPLNGAAKPPDETNEKTSVNGERPVEPKSARGAPTEKRPVLKRSLSQTERSGTFFGRKKDSGEGKSNGDSNSSGSSSKEKSPRLTKSKTKTFGRKAFKEGPLQRDDEQARLVAQAMNAKRKASAVPSGSSTTLPKRDGRKPSHAYVSDVNSRYQALSAEQVSEILERHNWDEERARLDLANAQQRALGGPLLTQSFTEKLRMSSQEAADPKMLQESGDRARKLNSSSVLDVESESLQWSQNGTMTTLDASSASVSMAGGGGGFGSPRAHPARVRFEEASDELASLDDIVARHLRDATATTPPVRSEGSLGTLRTKAMVDEALAQIDDLLQETQTEIDKRDLTTDFDPPNQSAVGLAEGEHIHVPGLESSADDDEEGEYDSDSSGFMLANNNNSISNGRRSRSDSMIESSSSFPGMTVPSKTTTNSDPGMTYTTSNTTTATRSVNFGAAVTAPPTSLVTPPPTLATPLSAKQTAIASTGGGANKSFQKVEVPPKAVPKVGGSASAVGNNNNMNNAAASVPPKQQQQQQQQTKLTLLEERMRELEEERVREERAKAERVEQERKAKEERLQKEEEERARRMHEQEAAERERQKKELERKVQEELRKLEEDERRKKHEREVEEKKREELRRVEEQLREQKRKQEEQRLRDEKKMQEERQREEMLISILTKLENPESVVGPRVGPAPASSAPKQTTTASASTSSTLSAKATAPKKLVIPSFDKAVGGGSAGGNALKSPPPASSNSTVPSKPKSARGSPSFGTSTQNNATVVEDSDKRRGLLRDLLAKGIITQDEYAARMAKFGLHSPKASGEEPPPPVPAFPGLDAFDLGGMDAAADNGHKQQGLKPLRDSAPSGSVSARTSSGSTKSIVSERAVKFESAPFPGVKVSGPKKAVVKAAVNPGRTSAGATSGSTVVSSSLPSGSGPGAGTWCVSCKTRLPPMDVPVKFCPVCGSKL